MSWMKRRGQPSPNPTNSGVPMYNPNQHSNTQQTQQWQQPQPQQYNNDWFNQSNEPNNHPSVQQLPQQTTNNYWSQPSVNQPQSYNQPQQNQFQNFNQFSNNQPQAASYFQPEYQQQNYYQSQQQDPWNWDWDDNSNTNLQQQNEPVPNPITDSFANDESWNWSVEDSSSQNRNPELVAAPKVEEKEKTDILEDLPAIRRLKTENLTPQWSIESQVSQDSSEDVLLTSESDNRSNILSQSSTTSQSPSCSASEFISQYKYGQESSQNQQPIENKLPNQEEPINSEFYQENSQKCLDKLAELSLNAQFENKEIVAPENIAQKYQEDMLPPVKNTSPPLQGNPYKKTTNVSNKIEKQPQNILSVNLETLPDNSERPDQLPVENIVRKSSSVQQQWENCEIAPINDRNQYLETGQLSNADLPIFSQSEPTQGTSGDNSDSLPPPGLCRLVLGQMEQPEVGQTVEPPPGLSRMVPGAFESKRVTPSRVFQNSDYQNSEEPPVGLHRMIPGESSSPESSTYLFQNDSNVFQTTSDNYTSETEMNRSTSQRSATIGADTPPVSNQQTISVTGYSSSSSGDAIPSREGAVGIDNDSNQIDLISNTEDNIEDRREDIDGGPQDNILGSVRDQTVGHSTVTNPPVNLAQNEKARNRNYTTDSEHEQPKERHNHNQSPKGRYDKERRYFDDRRERQRERDSPDRYHSERKLDKRRQKDRRYEEDTDYYSDKERSERRHRDEREEYDRRFSSLKRDKDRDGRRQRRDYDRRDDYYYQNRYDREYYNRSRPSSRSDSMHDSYRERNIRQPDRDLDRTRHRDRDRVRDRDHDRDHHRRNRDPYNPYYQGYNYDPYNNSYYQQYHYKYYENLRRTNPQAYAEWYRKYYQQQGGALPHAAGYSTEDRASVHSGRSSANEELHKDRYTRQSYYSQQSIPHYYREPQNASTVYTVDDSRLPDQTDSSLNLEDTTATSHRLTPCKFTTAHTKASISSGNLLNILPHYPLDGQPATLEIISVQSILSDDEELKELVEFPGPLIRGVTHKKTLIEFCEGKIRKAQGNANLQDGDSYVLMWELMILLLRQNGVVVGTDIAELLMKNRPLDSTSGQSLSSASSTQQMDTLGEVSRNSPSVIHKEDYVTDKFREYLIYGSEKEALEWAMKHGLWGHALFLASKLDKRTYANVMMRFANGLTMNDPLQTLYQLLSGRQPAAVTSVADEKWGDWRPHLAMILSNTSQRPDLDRKSIMTLGDTLQQRGCLNAAHFCYLMAQIEFGRFNSPNVKLVLLGSSHLKPFKIFATNEAIFLTEVYEYACGLSDAAFVIPEFQTYKYLMATKMADHGLLEKALNYLERVALFINQNPSRTQITLVARVCELADRLKYFDPIPDETDLDSSRSDNNWLTDLKNVLNDMNLGVITNPKTESQLHHSDQQQLTYQQQTDYYQQTSDQQNIDYNNQSQQLNYQPTDIQQTNYDSVNFQEQFWGQQQQQQNIYDENQGNDLNNQQISEDVDQKTNNYWNSAQVEPTDQQKNPPIDDSGPQISMPNQTSNSKSYFDDEETIKPAGKPASPVKSASVEPKQSSSGWFGGIWSKLALRPKNQMKLPDDKNPTIVWDSEKKRWVNLEEDNNDTTQELKPPPKMSDMFANRPVSGPQSLPAQINDQNPPNFPGSQNIKSENDVPKPPTAQQPNMFKLQRGRNIKKAYVDVFNPSNSKPVKDSIPAPEIFNSTPVSGHNQHNYFVPQTVGDTNTPTDFLTPQNSTNENSHLQLSRWSSASSLSREVQFYLSSSQKSQDGAPLMYNPSQFSNQ